jgi:hypothetical protein
MPKGFRGDKNKLTHSSTPQAKAATAQFQKTELEIGKVEIRV